MHKLRATPMASAGSRELSGRAIRAHRPRCGHRLAARYLAIAGLLAAAGGLVACESTRALVATPAATPWPAGSYLRVTLLLARPATATQPARPNTVFILATDSAGVTDALPPEVASASTVALIGGGVSYPLAAGSQFPQASGATLSTAVLYGNPPSVAAWLPRSDGTQDFSFLVDQRLVRTFPASVSIIP